MASSRKPPSFKSERFLLPLSSSVALSRSNDLRYRLTLRQRLSHESRLQKPRELIEVFLRNIVVKYNNMVSRVRKALPSFFGLVRIQLEHASQRKDGSCELGNLIRLGLSKKLSLISAVSFFVVLKLRLYGSMQ